MTTTTRGNRPLASLRFPRSVPAYLGAARAVVQAMTGNPSFADPDPSLAAVTEAIDALSAADVATYARTHGSVATRNERKRALVIVIQQLRAYVQKTADASFDSGASIIESAGMHIHKPTTHGKGPFRVKQVRSGSVKLMAETVPPPASYQWQCSTDGGATWRALPTTLQAKTTVSGLLPGATVSFRFRAVTRAGERDWSGVVSMIVS